jgi:hypothetical protein
MRGKSEGTCLLVRCKRRWKGARNIDPLDRLRVVLEGMCWLLGPLIASVEGLCCVELDIM